MRKALGILLLFAAWSLVRGLTTPQVCNRCCVLEAPPRLTEPVDPGAWFGRQGEAAVVPVGDDWSAWLDNAGLVEVDVRAASAGLDSHRGEPQSESF